MDTSTTPTSTTSSGFSGGSTSQQHKLPHLSYTSSSNANRIVRKRNRVPLSCGPCRNRKLKCNRHNPCDNCTRRNDQGSCTYAATVTPTRRRHAAASGDEMQSRIDRLEGLVLSLMDGKSPPSDEGAHRHSAGPSDRVTPGPHEHIDEEEAEDSLDEVSNELGFMKVQGDKSLYRGNSHWAAILGEITGVKKMFHETKKRFEIELQNAQRKQLEVPTELAATGFPFSAGKPPDRAELLALMPREEICGMCLDAYFRNYNPMFHVLHRPTFYKQYAEFRAAPDKVDLCWVSLLMIMLSIGVRILTSNETEPSELRGKNLAIALRVASEQCLIVGGYLRKPHHMHTVQAMIILNSFSGWKQENVDQTWICMGTTIRIALSMGLQRDPAFFPDIPPGDAELRRRVWTQLMCMDILSSIQIGLPTMLKSSETDTQRPANLHDDEITSEGALPPEHPHTEMTGVSFMIAKSKLAQIYSEIVQSISRIAPRPPYTDILRLEKALEELHQNMPEFLRYRSLRESTADQAWLILQRYTLETMFLRGIIMLHRQFASRSTKNPRYLHSRDRCLHAAMNLLDNQYELHQAAETSAQRCKWFIDIFGGSDFLHAAMIVGLHLSMTLGDNVISHGLWVDARGQGPWAGRETDEERRRMFRTLVRYRDMVRGEVKGDEPGCVSKAEAVINVVLDRLVRDEVFTREDVVEEPVQEPVAVEPGPVLAPPVGLRWPGNPPDLEDVGMQEVNMAQEIQGDWDEWDAFMKGMDLPVDLGPGWGDTGARNNVQPTW